MKKTAFEQLSDLVFFLTSAVACPAIAVMIAVDVFCRYVLGAPIFWAQEITTLLLLLFFFGAQPICLREDAHVRMGLLHDRLPGAWQAAIAVLTNISAMFIAALIVYRLIHELTDPFSRGDTHGFLEVPVAPFRILVAICMILFFMEAARRLCQPFKRDK